VAAWIGISGYDYPAWRHRFYEGVPRARWLPFAGSAFRSLELNGTFYSLKSPAAYAGWAAAAPSDRVLAVKGGRFITHMKQLLDVEQALANFYASGVLALGAQTGPFLWQLPERLAFDPARLARFFAQLPRSSSAAAALARHHDARVRVPLVHADVDVPYRHALEPRHPSFFTREAQALLRDHEVAFVTADSAGVFPISYAVTAPFHYVRLHGPRQLYRGHYRDDELDAWAERVRAWQEPGRDVYVYFDNDGDGHAPYDALRLQARVDRAPYFARHVAGATP
jgi:uncharacterized protein YecE (DUF72 family)